jgi:ATP-dependent RNA helicase DeaD
VTTFTEIGIDERLVEQLNKINFTSPTEVQEVSIPLILQGKDVVVRAKTGTGKTGAFLIPVINKIWGTRGLKAIVLTPTRELAKQVAEVADKMGREAKLHVVTVYGGASINAQLDALRRGANIVVGTPGRILDLISRDALNLSKIEYLILDEADVMLDMGFIDDAREIISYMPRERQTMLFSATIPREILSIAKTHMKKDRENIVVGEEEEVTVQSISHYYAVAGRNQKFRNLLAYIEQYDPAKAIIFTNTKDSANKIHYMLKQMDLNVILLHGGLTQAERERSLSNFKRGSQFLIATNVASRGLDIPDVTDIINYDAPDTGNSYVHRVGRSARMGKDGRAFTIISSSEQSLISDIKRKANVKMKILELDLENVENVQMVSSTEFYGQRGNRGDRPGRGDYGGRSSGGHSGPRRYGNSGGRGSGVSRGPRRYSNDHRRSDRD